MSKVHAAGELVRTFLIDNIDGHPTDIVRLTAKRFDCSRQAVHKHLLRLIAEDAVVVNNVTDHSGANHVVISVGKTAAATTIKIYDDGVGIFKKIQAAINLADERHAVLELAKGKFTTDPTKHAGEGIFFSSRMFDAFDILSGEVYFAHDFGKTEDWVLQPHSSRSGTLVNMRLHNHTARPTKKVFDQFASDEDYGFNRTVVPVKLMQYGDDNLISRSQAKRLLARFERFKTVVLDFAGVSSIGQAFADEVFRVFRAEHPEVELVPVHTEPDVRRMITRAESLAANGGV
ncbi:MAG: DUF4325 domain-containing protein [Deltaproteobacteria bacterium]|nr:DUF4325 domain-containing protein [Deltaproteobacteria bacterium]